MRDILGSGWAFPVHVDPRGRVALARQERDIEQAMLMILLTPVGQRLMRPEFGCRVHELIFAPDDATTRGLIVSHVERALKLWEPRIDLNAVRVDGDAEHPGRLLIRIDYRVRATNDPRSLVYPFYRIPGE